MNIANATTDPVSFQDAMADVARHFERPEGVLLARNLDRDQKITLLRQWDQDLRQLMVAAEENMPPEGADRTGDQLRLVQAALSTLGVEKEEDGPPTKTGG